MNAVNKLALCEFEQEVYHSDGFGHIQVEVVSNYDFGSSPLELLSIIDQESLWPEFFVMISSKTEEWLLELVSIFPLTEFYSTNCFVEFMGFLSSREALVNLLWRSPEWLWSEGNISLIHKVINKITEIIDGPPIDSLDYEDELVMLNGINQKLKVIQSRVNERF